MNQEAPLSRRATDRPESDATKTLRTFYRRLLICYVFALSGGVAVFLDFRVVAIVLSICSLVCLFLTILAGRTTVNTPEEGSDDDDHGGGHPLPV